MYRMKHLGNTPDNNKILLEHFEFHKINQAKMQERFKNLKAEKIYEILRNDFNTLLVKENETLKKLNENKEKQKLKQQQKPLNKMSKNFKKELDKANRKVVNEIEKEITRKNQNENDFSYKKEFKAFEGSFHQVNFKLADDANYEDLKVPSQNVILNKLNGKPSDKNLQVSVRILYDKIKDENFEILYKQIFSSDYAVILRNGKNIVDFVNELIEALTNHIVEHENGPSNMKFLAFTGLQIQFTIIK